VGNLFIGEQAIGTRRMYSKRLKFAKD